MTTKVHIVNFGPDVVDVTLVDPTSGSPNQSAPSLYAQQSVDVYVHSTQEVRVSKKKEKA